MARPSLIHSRRVICHVCCLQSGVAVPWETLKNAQMSFPKVGGKLSHARARSYSLMTFLKLFSAYRVFFLVCVLTRLRLSTEIEWKKAAAFYFFFETEGNYAEFSSYAARWGV